MSCRLTPLILTLVALVGTPAAADETQDPVSPWYFCLHGSEVGHDLDRSREVLRRARELGGSGVRTDVFWYELEPQRGRWDASKLRFYDGYVDLARASGLDPLIIISGAPGWARRLYRQDPKAFWRSYEAFVERVVRRLADRVERWQLWNEANHPVVDFVRARDEGQLFLRTGRIVRRLDPRSLTFVNVFADWPGWERAVTRWLAAAGSVIDGIGVDHYPGTWSWRSPTDWQPVRVLLRRINTPGDAWYGKRGAVLETGFSAWPRGDEAQRRWIRTALPALRDLLRSSSKRRYRVELLGYYQLVDAPGAPAQEGAFGILGTDLRPKRGAADLAREIGKFRRPRVQVRSGPF